MQVGIEVQVGKMSKINKSAGWNNAMQVGILGNVLLQIMVFFFQISKFNKSASWKILKFNKVYCTIIWETKECEKAKN